MNTSRFSSLSSDLLAALAQPFPARYVELRMGAREQRGQRWMCQAVPFVPRRYYEDRLNALVPGQWNSTTPVMRETAGRLVIAAQVQIFGVTHTDYAERPLRPFATLHEKEVESSHAQAAFEYAFVGACARFGLERYLADLERRWVPYDPRHRRIQLSSQEQLELVLGLYREAHIPLALDRPGRLCPSYPGWPPYDPELFKEEGRARQVHAAPASLLARDLAWVRARCDQATLQHIFLRFRCFPFGGADGSPVCGSDHADSCPRHTEEIRVIPTLFVFSLMLISNPFPTVFS